MVSQFLAAALLAAAPSGDTVLLDFTASWCGPCQSMNPVVERLTSAGYPVRKVDIDACGDLAARYGVASVPTFVMLVDGREVDRVVGAAPYDRLVQMFERTGRSRAVGARETGVRAKGGRLTPLANARRDTVETRASAGRGRNSSPDAATPANGRPDDSHVSKLVSASVRLRVKDATGDSFGSGTIIDVSGDKALVLTCGHIFRDSRGQGEITVDVFGPPAENGVTGRLIGYDLQRDLGLVVIQPEASVTAARVAPSGTRPAKGDRVITVGCDHGKSPTARITEIAAIDKYLGPPNIVVADEPVQGRSGGGLFASDGTLIGVCNAADPRDKEGLYAALGSIHAELDRSKLGFVYQQANAPDADKIAQPSNSPPDMARSMPLALGDNRRDDVAQPDSRGGDSRFASANDERADAAMRVDDRSAADAIAGLTPGERASLSSTSQSPDGAEVICIVRSLTDPRAKSDVVVLDRVSATFLDQLREERQAQASRQPTSMRAPRQSAPARTTVRLDATRPVNTKPTGNPSGTRRHAKTYPAGI